MDRRRFLNSGLTAGAVAAAGLGEGATAAEDKRVNRVAEAALRLS